MMLTQVVGYEIGTTFHGVFVLDRNLVRLIDTRYQQVHFAVEFTIGSHARNPTRLSRHNANIRNRLAKQYQVRYLTQP